jgi:hypothetical protein
MALSQGEAGFAAFDAGLTEPPELAKPGAGTGDSAEPKAAPAGRSSGVPGASDRRDLERFSTMLAGYARQQPAQRVNALRGLASVGDAAQDISHAQAEHVAKYLLSTKADDEHAEVLRVLAAIRHWKHLRLAVADLATYSQLTADQQQQLATIFVGREVAAESATGDGLRRVLIDSVLLDLSTAASRSGSDLGDPNLVFDTAAELLAEAYRQRARNFGISGPVFQPAASPGQAAELSLQPLAESLRGSAEDAPYLASLNHIHKAAAFLAGDDLRRTVAVQRLLVELSARRVVRQRPQHATAARQIDTESLAAITAPTSVLVQLREQEATLLKLWLLYAPEI